MPFAWSNGADVTDRRRRVHAGQPGDAEALEYYQSVLHREAVRQTDLAAGPARAELHRRQDRRVHLRPVARRAARRAGGAGFADKFGVVADAEEEAATSFIGGSNLAVFKDAKNRDGAWKFVQWLIRPDVQVKWYQAVSDLPAVQASWEDPSARRRPDAAGVRRAARGRQGAAGDRRPGSRSPRAIDAEIEKVVKAGAARRGRRQGHADRRPTSIGTGALTDDRPPRTPARPSRSRRAPRPPAGDGGASARRRRSPAGLLALPFTVLFAVFTAGPVLASLAMSFTDMRAARPARPVRGELVGLDNYIRLLADELFLQAAGQHRRTSWSSACR